MTRTYQVPLTVGYITAQIAEAVQDFKLSPAQAATLAAQVRAAQASWFNASMTNEQARTSIRGIAGQVRKGVVR